MKLTIRIHQATWTGSQVEHGGTSGLAKHGAGVVWAIFLLSQWKNFNCLGLPYSVLISKVEFFVGPGY